VFIVVMKIYRNIICECTYRTAVDSVKWQFVHVRKLDSNTKPNPNPTHRMIPQIICNQDFSNGVMEWMLFS